MLNNKVVKMDCLFCKIVKGEMPAKKVYEDDSVIAFLDINPANPGHTLVVPKKHTETIADIEDSDLEKVIVVVKNIAKKLKDELDTAGLNIVQNNGKLAGQLVSHIHFHVIPRFAGDQVIITYQRAQVDENKMEEIRKKLTEEAAPAPKDLDLDF